MSKNININYLKFLSIVFLNIYSVLGVYSQKTEISGYTDVLNKAIHINKHSNSSTNESNYVLNNPFQNLNYLDINIDTDGDGIPDVNDIDDDNDGIIDAIESPNCFYTYDEAKIRVSVSSDIVLNGSFSGLFDGANVTYMEVRNNQTFTTGESILKFEYESRIFISQIRFNVSTTGGLTGSGSGYNPMFIQLFGSNTNTSDFVPISNSVNVGGGQNMTLNIDNIVQNFKYYEIRFIGTTSEGNNSNAVIIQGRQLNHFVIVLNNLPHYPSLHPKSTPCLDDYDGDGIPNHLDTDSDNDLCYDAFEVTTVNVNQSSIQGGVNSDGLSNTLSYDDLNLNQDIIYKYKLFAQNKLLNSCQDFDLDGIPDIVDIDDDNDGILDADESPNCYYTLNEMARIKNITTPFAYPSSDSLEKLHDLVINNSSSPGGYFNFNEVSNGLVPGKDIFEIEFNIPVVLEYLKIIQVNRIIGATAFFRLYGLNDQNEYEPVSNTNTYNLYSLTTNNKFDVGSQVAYKKYAIRYIGDSQAGNNNTRSINSNNISEIIYRINTNTPYIASLHHKMGECIEDIDQDGFPNHLDTDCDGDGYPDAFEVGATGATNTSNFKFSGPYNIYGIKDDLYDLNTNTTKYVSRYEFLINPNINPISDHDNDGYKDYADVDDDNDGILDSDESSSCFHNIYDAGRIEYMHSFYSGTNGKPLAGENLVQLYDALFSISSDSQFRFASNQVMHSGDIIFDMTLRNPMVMSSFVIEMNSVGLSTSTSFGMLYGSTDKINYVPISLATNLNNKTTNIFINSDNPYKYYILKFIGLTATSTNDYISLNSNSDIRQVYFNVSKTVKFLPSLYPRKEKCNEDVDNDNFLNHQDIDSDGDGCSDSYESGATNNPTISSFSDVNTLGISNSLYNNTNHLYNYKSTYKRFALFKDLVLCADFDNDGVPDVIDIDDDNDGVLDTEEGSFCGVVDRNIYIGYVQRTSSTTTYRGPGRNMFLNLQNFGLSGTYNNLRGVIVVPFNNEAAVTEAELNERKIDIFFVGSPEAYGGGKATTALNLRLQQWVKNHPDKNKYIFAVQNNVENYGYVLRSLATLEKNVIPYSTIGQEIFINGRWQLPSNEVLGASNFSLETNKKHFELLLTNSNDKPTAIFDTELNTIIYADGKTYIDNFWTESVPNLPLQISNYGNDNGFKPENNQGKLILNLWAYLFDKIVSSNCTEIDTDGDSFPNHRDLDSDGDGCSDANESGATQSLQPNFQFASQAGTSSDINSDGYPDIVDKNNLNQLDGLPNYKGFYEIYAINASQNSCADTDGDSILDVYDVDDDNDGILDEVEGLKCNMVDREIIFGYYSPTPGPNGLMMNMLNNKDYFGNQPNSVYNKIEGVIFKSYNQNDILNTTKLIDDHVDMFYVGSSIYDVNNPVSENTAHNAPELVNKKLYNWAKDNDKVLVVVQNNALNYGYQIQNERPTAKPYKPYGELGNRIFTNGYFPIIQFDPKDEVQMVINSDSRSYDVLMTSKLNKAGLVRDRELKLIIVPDATVLVAYQGRTRFDEYASGASQDDKDEQTNAMKTAANIFAYAFDTFLEGYCQTRHSDDDGIPDHLDSDSDNDGCPDSIEGSMSIKYSDVNSPLGDINIASYPVNGNNSDNPGLSSKVITLTEKGQGIGASILANLKDKDCYDLVLANDVYTGEYQQQFNTGNILDNDRLDNVMPVIGSGNGQVVISQSGTWPEGITLNTQTGIVTVSSTVVGSLFLLNYQVCVNGIMNTQNPSLPETLCKIAQIKITICSVSNVTPEITGPTEYDDLTGVYKISCQATTPLKVALNTLSATNIPPGSILSWHSDSIPSDENKLDDNVELDGYPSKVIYAVFYNEQANCYPGSKPIVIYTPICAVDDDYTSDPAIFGQSKTYATIFGNDKYAGLGLTMPHNNVSVTSSSISLLDENGNLTIPENYPAGDHSFTYTIKDNSLTGVSEINESTATVKFRVMSCSNTAQGGAPNSFTNTGVSNIIGFGTQGLGWPNNVQNGYVALESVNSGLVITRVDNVSNILNPQEGMIAYDISADCVKLYNGLIWKCIEMDCN